jgi:hypothetical protein
MPDPFNRRCARRRDPDAERVRFAAANLRRHHDREHHFLQLAVEAADDAASRLWEVCADDAYRDATAIAEEHELEAW